MIRVVIVYLILLVLFSIFLYKDSVKLARRYWKTVPIRLYSAIELYDIIFNLFLNKMNGDFNRCFEENPNCLTTMCRMDTVERPSIEAKLGPPRPDYVTLKFLEMKL